MNRFRPQEFNKRWAIKHFRQTGHTMGEYNWQSRTRYYRDCDRNHKHLIRTFAQLHYLGSHAPAPIRAKWRKVEQQFMNKYVPKNATYQYLTRRNKWVWL